MIYGSSGGSNDKQVRIQTCLNGESSIIYITDVLDLLKLTNQTKKRKKHENK